MAHILPRKAGPLLVGAEQKAKHLLQPRVNAPSNVARTDQTSPLQGLTGNHGAERRLGTSMLIGELPTLWCCGHNLGPVSLTGGTGSDHLGK
ncbi:MAG: hypothetical protein LBV00_02290 [Propionibacteriaceae bacterium]|nr:hypothetical protein [Propionibacteriaceae bacterium]